MPIGVSSSCLYPFSPRESLETIAKLGVKTSEVFFNSPSEITLEYAKKLNKIKNEYGIDIISLHPYTSFAETVMLFSEYERRFTDTLEYYKQIFEVTAEIGAGITVIHGSKLPGKIKHEKYFERFAKMIEAGKSFGITVAQENVNNHFSQNPEFMKAMRTYLGDDFKMIFDVKQSVRAGFEPLAFAKEFANEIVHVHLSDHKEGFDCLPPSKGVFDFGALFEIMKKADYSGSYVIELYRHNYGEPEELKSSLDYLNGIFNA